MIDCSCLNNNLIYVAKDSGLIFYDSQHVVLKVGELDSKTAVS